MVIQKKYVCCVVMFDQKKCRYRDSPLGVTLSSAGNVRLVSMRFAASRDL
jgi:hypothetical protein